jgi:hypothetical protein
MLAAAFAVASPIARIVVCFMRSGGPATVMAPRIAPDASTIAAAATWTSGSLSRRLVA